MQYSYLLINLGAILIPLIFSFHPRLQFHKTWKALFPSMLITAFLFILWDVVFTEWGIWGFNDTYLSGYYIYNLPIEEILFFICIPYACVFTWHVFLVVVPQYKNIWSPYEAIISWGFMALLLSTILLSHEKMYTIATCSLLLGYLIFVRYIQKVRWLGAFYTTYIVLLIPFFIVNGLLTGFAFQEPIVWYDNSENLNIRLATIPIEDLFYGMLLIGMNISLYEYFKEKRYLEICPKGENTRHQISKITCICRDEMT